MVKIPELPSSYRPGDVVNGHVLTERGHWVALDEPDALPHVEATPSTGGSVPAPPLPSGPGRRRPNRVIFYVIAALVGLQVVAGITGQLTSTDEGTSEVATATDVHPEVVEVWQDDVAQGFVVELRAVGLGTELAGVQVDVDGLAADGTLLATGSRWVYVRDSEIAVVVGTFRPVAGVDPSTPVVEALTTLTIHESMSPDPQLLVEDVVVGEGTSPVEVGVTITAAPLASADAVVSVVVRDGEGTIFTAATEQVSDVGAAPQEVRVTLPGLDQLLEDHSVETHVAAR